MKEVFSICLLLVIGMVSCSKEEEAPAWVGDYAVNSLRDECDDPSKGGSVARNEYGVCVNVAGGKDCIELKIFLKSDNSYMLTSQVTELRTGSVNKRNQLEDVGTYTVSNTSLTLVNGKTNSTTQMVLINNFSGIDWEVSNQNACRRLYSLQK